MNTPKDGYYIASVQYNTGGTLQTYVHVQDGIIRSNSGNELRVEACSEFAELGTLPFCAVWPERAAMELDTLRTANAGLVEKLRDLERERDHANDTADAVLSEDKMLRAKLQALEAARTQAAANSLANMLSYEEVVERMKRLEEALDIGVGASYAKTLINNHVDYDKGQP